MKNDKLNRRQFVKGSLGAMLGVAVARVSSAFPEAQVAFAKTRNDSISQDITPEIGELYAGFLLLPADAPLPEFVQMPSQDIPIVCGVGVGRGGPEPTADSEELRSTDELKNELDFEMYVWDDVLRGLHLQKPSLIRYPTGDVFHVAIGIERFDEENNSWGTIARISAQPDFSRPYPLWEALRDDLEDMDDDIGLLQKADYLPVLGVMVQTVDGYVFHWIENDISYTLTTEEDLSFAESREILDSLRK